MNTERKHVSAQEVERSKRLYVENLRALGYLASDDTAPHRALRAYFGRRCPTGRVADLDSAGRIEAIGYLTRVNESMAASRRALRGRDYGQDVNATMRDLPAKAAPSLLALLALLEEDGHDMAVCRAELAYFIRIAMTAGGW